MIMNSTLNPENDIHYSYRYNGFGNMTSVFKAPMYASKPYYYQCKILVYFLGDNMEEEMPNFQLRNYTPGQSNDIDDYKLYNESWIDIEPYSGAVVRAAQKLMISVLIEKDDLFEIDNKFVPIYYIFRTGNFSESSVIKLLIK